MTGSTIITKSLAPRRLRARFCRGLSLSSKHHPPLRSQRKTASFLKHKAMSSDRKVTKPFILSSSIAISYSDQRRLSRIAIRLSLALNTACRKDNVCKGNLLLLGAAVSHLYCIISPDSISSHLLECFWKASAICVTLAGTTVSRAKAARYDRRINSSTALRPGTLP